MRLARFASFIPWRRHYTLDDVRLRWLVAGFVVCESENGVIMNVYDAVVETIADVCSLDAGVIVPQSRLDNGLEMDEMRLIELAMALEEEFGIKIPQEDFELFETVSDIVKYIERVRGTQEEPA